jgi:hypothetical protein
MTSIELEPDSQLTLEEYNLDEPENGIVLTTPFLVVFLRYISVLLGAFMLIGFVFWVLLR